MLSALCRWADEIVLTQYVENPRGVPVECLQEVIAGLPPTSATVAQEDDPSGAWERVWSSAGPDDLICVTGSLFLAAELRDQMTRDVNGSTDGRSANSYLEGAFATEGSDDGEHKH